MKISHRQLRLILRILFSLGIVLGILVFIYELIYQRSVTYSVCYITYLAAGGSVLYLVYARKRPASRWAYGTFFAMCFVTVLFFFSYIYEIVTIVPKMTKDLIEHIEGKSEVNTPIHVLIRLSKCCSIDEHRHTEETFQSFQEKYPNTCGTIQFDDAQPCLPFIYSQRNLSIFICSFIFTLRLLTLYLLWKYIKGEYNGIMNDMTNAAANDDEQSTATSLA